MVTRRKFIASAGTIGTVAIAGCSSVPLIGGGGPEKAVEQLFTAAKEGNVETAVHPPSSAQPLDEDSFTNLKLVSTEEVSGAELAESDSGFYQGATESDFRNTIIPDIKTETGASEVAFVMATIEQDGETIERPFVTVKYEGEWFVTI
jgi:hypothetical protein